MATNSRLIKGFLEATIKKNPEEGLILNDLSRLFNELNNRRASSDRVQSATFYPLVEMFCLFQDKEARIEINGNVRRIRGFGYQTEDIRRLVAIFVNGTGSSPDNIETVNRLFQPIISGTDSKAL